MLEAMPVKKLAAGGRPIVRVLPQPIYDREQLAAGGGGYTVVQFYSRPIGTPNGAGVNKTLQDTNLKQSGALAKPSTKRAA